MSTLGASYLTLADVYRRTDDKGTIPDIIEMMSQVNPIIADAYVEECNSGDRHLTTVRTGLPTVTWRKLYQAVAPDKSDTAQVYDTTGMAEAWSEVDAKIVDKAKDKAKTRLTESMSFIEAMNNEMATGIFYSSDKTDPEKFTGLDPRFNSTTAANGNQVVSAGVAGSGTNTSIWFVVWGPMTCHLLYPEGSMGGLKREDKGKQTKETTEGVYDVYREKFTWDIGLSVRDWRYISRVCNIDVSSLTASGSTGPALIDSMITAYYRLRQRKVMNGRAAIYCNSTIMEYLHKQATNKSTVNLTLSNVEGEEKVSFLGLPIRECEAIVNTESAIT